MSATAIVWDGIKNSYIPPDQLNISTKVKLHTTAEDDLDPVTYEVVRYNLWTINEEHGDTIVKVSGSPIAVFAHDFNPSILTEVGEFVYFGPYLQFHAGMLDVNVKWTLENRAESPGIEEGDMFIANDPWVGTTHQPDTAMICPVFWEGELFCWVANMLHLADVGGSTPGSFCPDADDVFQEPTPTPPLKLVEGGMVRHDIEDEFVRRSRLPDLVRLDLRAVIAGNTVATRRVQGLISRYGPDVVKAVMRKIASDGEARFLDRLRTCADGSWTAVNYLEVAKTGDRSTYKSVVTMTKEGDHLTFSNHGSEEQTGAINMTYAAFRGGVLSCVNAYFLYDALYAIGGATRHIKFDLEPGTFTCASHPAGCSLAGAIGVHLIIGQVQNTLAKMMMTSPSMNTRLMAQGGSSQWPGATCAGIDQRGNQFGGFMLDPMGAGLGAFANRDGVDTGGIWFDAKGFMPNVEQIEHTMPILYVYRKEIADSGGAGKFRGGNSAEWAFVAHKTDQLAHATSACGCAVPTAHGLSGGGPGAPNEYRFLHRSNVQEMMKNGRIPQDLADLDGELENLQPKQVEIAQTASDAYAIRWAGAAGFGDPLERDPQRVAADVRNEGVTAQTARDVYGVVLDDELEVDVAATDRRRRELTQARLAEAKPYDFERRPTAL
jgi:N-methylhydantoinase B